MRIHIDPAFHRGQYHEAFIREDDGEVRILKIKGDLSDAAKWIRELKTANPRAALSVDSRGPGQILIQILKEQMDISVERRNTPF